MDDNDGGISNIVYQGKRVLMSRGECSLSVVRFRVMHGR